MRRKPYLAWHLFLGISLFILALLITTLGRVAAQNNGAKGDGTAVLSPWERSCSADSNHQTDCENGALLLEKSSSIYLPIVSKDVADAPLCRFGVNASATPNLAALSELRTGWYMNYVAATNPPLHNGMEYMPVIRIEPITSAPGYQYWPTGAALVDTIAGNPGAKWLIGNEPDSIWQDNLQPATYARAYHELYHLIKSQDPAAQIIAGSIVQATEIRLLYLDEVLASYEQQFGQPLRADGWSIHNYILNEASCEKYPENCWGAEIPPGIDRDAGEILGFKDNTDVTRFIERIVRFRQWLVARGYSGQPLYLTEYGVLFWEDIVDEDGNAFPPSRVNAFMEATYDYMLTAVDPVLGDPNDGYRLVQQWAWFSTIDTTFNGTLFDPDTYALTDIGAFFAEYTAAVRSTVDFYPREISIASPAQISDGDPVTLTLQATVANGGNLAPPIFASVRFYDAHPQSGGMQIGSEQYVRLSGCGAHEQVSVQWSNVPSGTHEVYVKVAPSLGALEADPDNNLAVGQIFVATDVSASSPQRELPSH